jgi:hypothetical protein
MIEARAKDGRWMSGVLGGAKDHDGVGGLCLIALALPDDEDGNRRAIDNDRRQQQH